MVIDPGHFLLFAGAMLSGTTDKAEDYPEYPNEDPTTHELDEWLKTWRSSAKSTEAGMLLVGKTPTSLIPYSTPADLSDYKVLTSSEIKEPDKLAKHNFTATLHHE